MNSMDRLCLKGLTFLCLPLLGFTLLLNHVEEKELAQAERLAKPVCFPGDYVCELEQGLKHAVATVTKPKRVKIWYASASCPDFGGKPCYVVR